MKRSDELKEKRTTLLEDQKALLDLAKTEEGRRDFTEDEQTRFDSLTSEIEALDVNIEREEKIEKQEVRIASMKQPTKTPEQKINRNYSFVKAIRETAEGNLTGLEREIHEEAVREAKTKGHSVMGLGIPAFMMSPMSREEMLNRTTLTVGTAATAGNAVPTYLEGIIPALRPRLKTIELGATLYENLTGNLSIVRNAGGRAAAWEGETDAGAESNDTYEKINLTPNRLGAYTVMTKQLLFQNSVGVERDARASLENAIATAIDAAAINGLGSSNQPLGILGQTGIGDVAGGTNGAVPTWANIVGLETAVAVDNADFGKLAYLTTPGIKGLLKQTPKVASTDSMIWDINSSMINGYNSMTSTNVPSTLTKGSSGAVCHAIIYGDWSSLLIANWNGLDLVIDPYSGASTNVLKIYVNSWWDVDVKHVESFAAMKDALLS